MKTTCYCVYCKKHPLYGKADDFEHPGSYFAGDFYDGDKKFGKEVDCLEPVSSAFDDLPIEPEEFDYPITAYGDGVTSTGHEGRGFIIFAHCGAEEDGG